MLKLRYYKKKNQGRDFNSTIHVVRVDAGLVRESEGEMCSYQLRFARTEEVLQKATVQL